MLIIILIVEHVKASSAVYHITLGCNNKNSQKHAVGGCDEAKLCIWTIKLRMSLQHAKECTRGNVTHVIECII